VRVDVPKKLNKRQRELLTELSQHTTVDNKPTREKDFVSKVKEFFA